MLKSQTFIFKYNSREVSVKVKNGRYHYVYLRFKHLDYHFSVRFYILSSDYPTYESIKDFADNLKYFDKCSYDDYMSNHNNLPCYVMQSKNNCTSQKIWLSC